jgi:Flp pilus assembly protein TadG
MRLRRRDRQDGQAIVLIALVLVVLCGMLGLAIDSGRAYVDRRGLQDAVDAATLAAGDDYENFGQQAAAFNNATAVFERSLSLPAPSSSSTFGNTFTATFAGGYTYTITGANGSFNGYVFQATASHVFPLTFFQVLGSNPTIPVQAQASSIVGNQYSQPALLTLDPSACSLNLSGNTAVTVRGDVYSDGGICFTGSAGLGVAGNAFAHINPVPSAISLLCYNPDPTVAPHAVPCGPNETLGNKIGPNAPTIPDPNYPGGRQNFYLNSGGQVAHSGWTELTPGQYSAFSLTGGAGCYFFDAGIYTWNGGYTSHGGYSSNELKPPDEPAYNYTSSVLDYTQRASPQWYDASSCAGTFTLTAAPGAALRDNTDYAVELTSVRTDTYAPTGQSFIRESAPSMCHNFNTATSQSFVADVGSGQQVPGATSYNVYVAVGKCVSGQPAPAQTAFGYVGSFTESQHKFLLDGGSVPSGNWTLGVRNKQCLNSGALTVGCAPPDGEAKSVCFLNCTAGTSNGLAQENPPSAIFPHGDLANENYCTVQSTNAAAPCQGATITPGAVQFYFKNSGDCLNENGNGATGVFSGYQYDFIMIYEPVSNTNCGNTLNGGSYTSYIGTIYTPKSSWTINGGNRAPLSGQVIAWDAQLNGNATIGINFNPNYAPAPPAARLVQ